MPPNGLLSILGTGVAEAPPDALDKFWFINPSLVPDAELDADEPDDPDAEDGVTSTLTPVPMLLVADALESETDDTTPDAAPELDDGIALFVT